jgi:hypothetical protein
LVRSGAESVQMHEFCSILHAHKPHLTSYGFQTGAEIARGAARMWFKMD